MVRAIDDLPPGSRVGTDSPRRTGFLLARRPDVILHPLHGNVDTRLRRLDDGETDALILACAGLDRLGLGGRITQRIPTEVIPPAPGQGAIAVQVRRDDARMVPLVAAIDDVPTRDAVEAERAFLTAAGGGCRAPIGAFAKLEKGELVLLGGYAQPDGSSIVVGRRRGPTADRIALGQALARALDSQLRRSDDGGPNNRTPRLRVLVTRAAGQADGLANAIRDVGLEPIAVPAIAVEIEGGGGDLDAAARFLHRCAGVVVTSANGARALLEAGERVFTALETSRFAAIGPATRRVLEREGIAVDHQPPEARGAAMADSLPIEPGDRVLVVRGDLADEELPRALRARGAEVDDVVAYRTREAPEGSRSLLRHAMAAGPIAAAVFTSGSTVRGLVALGLAESLDVTSIPAICIGPETADEARAAGFRVLGVAPTPDASALAATAARALTLQPQEVS